MHAALHPPNHPLGPLAMEGQYGCQLLHRTSPTIPAKLAHIPRLRHTGRSGCLLTFSPLVRALSFVLADAYWESGTLGLGRREETILRQYPLHRPVEEPQQAFCAYSGFSEFSSPYFSKQAKRLERLQHLSPPAVFLLGMLGRERGTMESNEHRSNVLIILCGIAARTRRTPRLFTDGAHHNHILPTNRGASRTTLYATMRDEPGNNQEHIRATPMRDDALN